MNLVVTIMAAGEGKRMNSSIPKVLHLFHNKPILLRIIETAILLQPKNILIITGKYHELIKTTLSQYIDISNFIFVKQPIPQGTGDAIKSCLSYFESSDKVLILNGDMPLINDEIIRSFVNHRGNSSKMNILVATFDEPSGYGRIIYDDRGIFIGIIEEKDCSPEQRSIQIINSGLYLIDANLLQKYIPLIDNKNRQNEYYLTDIVRIIKENTDIMIDTYLINQAQNILISGVNTQEELNSLQNYIIL